MKEYKPAIISSPARAILFFIFVFTSFYATGRDNIQSEQKNPQIAIIGVQIMNIYQVEMSTNSFYADFYLWCRWKGEIDPLKNLEFLNSEEQWGFTKTRMYDSSLILKDGTKYNSLHIQGKFHHSYILNNYPLDQQSVSIEMENAIYTYKQLIYKPDRVNSGIQSDIYIPGWIINGTTFVEKNDVYSTNFGLPETAGNDSYCNLSMSLKLHRPIAYFLWKLMLPIFVVLLSSLGGILIFPGYTDARIYAPVGALLTAVFLQQSATANLPELSYLVLTDKIYGVVYVAILAGIYQAIFTANLVKSGSDLGLVKAKKLDRIFAVCILLFLSISAIILFFT